LSTPDECKARAEGAEALIKEGKTKFRGEVRTFKYGDVTVKVFVQDHVIVQSFTYPFDLKADSTPLVNALNKSHMFDDCVRQHCYIMKARLPYYQKYFGHYLKVEREDPSGSGVYVLVDVDLEGFRKDALPKLR
jgi:hypothetical protein